MYMLERRATGTLNGDAQDKASMGIVEPESNGTLVFVVAAPVKDHTYTGRRDTTCL